MFGFYALLPDLRFCILRAAIAPAMAKAAAARASPNRRLAGAAPVFQATGDESGELVWITWQS